MTGKLVKIYLFCLAGCLLLAAALPAAASAASSRVNTTQVKGFELQARFQYLLASFSGPVRSQWARLDLAPDTGEIYTFQPGENLVRIFNPQGMEIYSFGDQGEIPSLLDIAAGPAGTLFGLPRDFSTHQVQVFNYRGEQRTPIAIAGASSDLSRFSPDRLEYEEGMLYLLDASALRILVVDRQGKVHDDLDLDKLIKKGHRSREDLEEPETGAEVTGFDVGPDGSLYFTIAARFSAYILKPDGGMTIFGTAGSAPGRFGVVSGVAIGGEGQLYVADRLRSVVMVFSPQLRFQGEFGYRGGNPADMIVPFDLAVDPGSDRIFVSQAANKGVGVYTVKVLTPH